MLLRAIRRRQRNIKRILCKVMKVAGSNCGRGVAITAAVVVRGGVGSGRREEAASVGRGQTEIIVGGKRQEARPRPGGRVCGMLWLHEEGEANSC